MTISTRVAYQRINRKLKQEGQVLRSARSPRARAEVGDYYVIDAYRNAIVLMHVDLLSFGKKLTAIQPWEKIQ